MIILLYLEWIASLKQERPPRCAVLSSRRLWSLTAKRDFRTIVREEQLSTRTIVVIIRRFYLTPLRVCMGVAIPTPRFGHVKKARYPHDQVLLRRNGVSSSVDPCVRRR